MQKFNEATIYSMSTTAIKMWEVSYPTSQQRKQDFQRNAELARVRNVHKGRHLGYIRITNEV